jgi:hypothetical protein
LQSLALAHLVASGLLLFLIPPAPGRIQQIQGILLNQDVLGVFSCGANLVRWLTSGGSGSKKAR